ncbi:hypothetical protein CJP74_00305 [Psittacicella melopsittaci]|uniref:Uncharacterized protein n=1 Tax=Psittacicella melopsittaci TaxID=2028576 RepID=A0A3A1Y9Q4_9GAMM|nr:hypothetical protein [Psittacicella melopsittaci]RIY34056.1 hypothetical protein CJP74_00305 [Psittacicella melopsittaci]
MSKQSLPRLKVFVLHGQNSLTDLKELLNANTIQSLDFKQAYTYRGIENIRFHSMPFVFELGVDNYPQIVEFNFIASNAFPSQLLDYQLVQGGPFGKEATRKVIPFAQLASSTYNLSLYRLVYDNLYQNVPASLMPTYESLPLPVKYDALPALVAKPYRVSFYHTELNNLFDPNSYSSSLKGMAPRERRWQHDNKYHNPGNPPEKGDIFAAYMELARKKNTIEPPFYFGDAVSYAIYQRFITNPIAKNIQDPVKVLYHLRPNQTQEDLVTVYQRSETKFRHHNRVEKMVNDYIIGAVKNNLKYWSVDDLSEFLRDKAPLVEDMTGMDPKLSKEFKAADLPWLGTYERTAFAVDYENTGGVKSLSRAYGERLTYSTTPINLALSDASFAKKLTSQEKEKFPGFAHAAKEYLQLYYQQKITLQTASDKIFNDLNLANAFALKQGGELRFNASLKLPEPALERAKSVAPYLTPRPFYGKDVLKDLDSYLYFMELAHLEQEPIAPAKEPINFKRTANLPRALVDFAPFTNYVTTQISQIGIRYAYLDLLDLVLKKVNTPLTFRQLGRGFKHASKLIQGFWARRGNSLEERQVAQAYQEALIGEEQRTRLQQLVNLSQYSHFLTWANQFGPIGKYDLDPALLAKRSKDFTLGIMLESNYDSSKDMYKQFSKGFYLLNPATFAVTSRLFGEYNYPGFTNYNAAYYNPYEPMLITGSARLRLRLEQYKAMQEDLRLTPLNIPAYLEEPRQLAYEQIIYRSALANIFLAREYKQSFSPMSSNNLATISARLNPHLAPEQRLQVSLSPLVNQDPADFPYAYQEPEFVAQTQRPMELVELKKQKDASYPVRKLQVSTQDPTVAAVMQEIEHEYQAQIKRNKISYLEEPERMLESFASEEAILKAPLQAWMQMFPQLIWRYNTAKEYFKAGGKGFGALGNVYYHLSTNTLPSLEYPNLADKFKQYFAFAHNQIRGVGLGLPPRKSYENILMKALYNRVYYIMENVDLYLMRPQNLTYFVSLGLDSFSRGKYNRKENQLYLDVFAQEVKLQKASNFKAKTLGQASLSLAKRQKTKVGQVFADFSSPAELQNSYNLPTTRWQYIASATLDPQVYTYDADPAVNMLRFRNNTNLFAYDEQPLMRNASDVFANYVHLNEFYERLRLDLTVTNSVFIASKAAADGFFTTLAQELEDKLSFMSEHLRKALLIPALNERSALYAQQDTHLFVVPIPIEHKPTLLEQDLESYQQKWRHNLQAQDFEQAREQAQKQGQILPYPVDPTSLELWFVYQLFGDRLDFINSKLDRINLALYLKALEPAVKVAYDLSEAQLQDYKVPLSQMLTYFNPGENLEELFKRLTKFSQTELADFVKKARLLVRPQHKTRRPTGKLAWLNQLTSSGVPDNLEQLVQQLSTKQLEQALDYIAQLDGQLLWLANLNLEQEPSTYAFAVDTVNAFSAYLPSGVRLAPSASYALESIAQAQDPAYVGNKNLKLASLEQFAQSKEPLLWQSLEKFFAQEKELLESARYQLQLSLTQGVFTPGKGTSAYCVRWLKALVQHLNLKAQTGLACRFLSTHPSRVFASSLAMLYPEFGYRGDDAIAEGIFSRFYIAGQATAPQLVPTLAGELDLNSPAAPLLYLWQQAGLSRAQLEEVLATDPETAKLLEQAPSNGFNANFKAYLYFTILPQLLNTPVFNLEQMQKQLDKVVKALEQETNLAPWHALEYTPIDLFYKSFAKYFSSLAPYLSKDKEPSKQLGLHLEQTLDNLYHQGKLELGRQGDAHIDPNRELGVRYDVLLSQHLNNTFFNLTYAYATYNPEELAKRASTALLDPEYHLFKGTPAIVHAFHKDYDNDVDEQDKLQLNLSVLKYKEDPMYKQARRIHYQYNEYLKNKHLAPFIPLYLPLASIENQVIQVDPSVPGLLSAPQIAQLQKGWYKTLPYFFEGKKRNADPRVFDLTYVANYNWQQVGSVWDLFLSKNPGKDLYSLQQLYLAHAFSEREVARNLVTLRLQDKVPQALYLPARPLHLLYATSEESTYLGKQSHELLATFRAHAQILQQKLFNALMRQYHVLEKLQDLPRVAKGQITLPFESLNTWRTTITKTPFYSARLESELLNKFLAEFVCEHGMDNIEAEKALDNFILQTKVYRSLPEKREQTVLKYYHEAGLDYVLNAQAPRDVNFEQELNLHQYGVSRIRNNPEKLFADALLRKWAIADRKRVPLDEEQLFADTDFEALERNHLAALNYPSSEQQEFSFAPVKELEPTLGWQELTTATFTALELLYKDFYITYPRLSASQAKAQSLSPVAPASYDLRALQEAFASKEKVTHQLIARILGIKPNWKFKAGDYNFKARCEQLAQVLMHTLVRVNQASAQPLHLADLCQLFVNTYRVFMQVKVMVIADQRLLEATTAMNPELLDSPYVYVLNNTSSFQTWAEQHPQVSVIFASQNKSQTIAHICNTFAQAQQISLMQLEETEWYPYFQALVKAYTYK